ncbi:hypothetical protein [Clostridium sp. B9]|uniref:hypothetical protein n=1 Tax=Clostridium sp. B9 TaxID=3423224 RepID=UPI003D2EFB42
MKKIISLIIPSIIFIAIISWGVMGVNIENTEAFNNKEYEVSEQIDYDKIKEETGMDLTVFSEDNTPIKIYENKDEFYLVFKEHILNLNKGIIGSVLVGTFNIMNNIIDNINEFIGNNIIM